MSVFGTRTVWARYEVNVEGLAMLDKSCGKRAKAFELAKELHEKARSWVENPVVYVQDRLAKVGMPELWYLVDGKMVVKCIR